MFTKIMIHVLAAFLVVSYCYLYVNYYYQHRTKMVVATAATNQSPPPPTLRLRPRPPPRPQLKSPSQSISRDNSPCRNPDVIDNLKFYHYYTNYSGNKEELLEQWAQLGRQTVHPDFPLSPFNFQPLNTNKGEQITKQAMEYMFPRHSWKKVRPKWLVNPKTQARLELDVYCEALAVAVEYNGIQHYVYDDEHKKNPWCKNFDDFDSQIWRDGVKKQVCNELGLTLLIVPYWVPKCLIASYIFCRFCESLHEM